MPGPERVGTYDSCSAAGAPRSALHANNKDFDASGEATALVAGGRAGHGAMQRFTGIARSYFPILEWAPAYRKEYLFQDVTGGVTLGLMSFMQTLVGATIATVLPICGPYSAFVPTIVYAIMGSSRHASVSEGAVGSILVACVVGDHPDVYYRTSVAMLIALMVGVMQLAMCACRVGFVVRFLSHSCIHGYTSGCAFVVIASQLKTAVGLDVTRPRRHSAIGPMEALGLQWVADLSGGRDVVTKTVTAISMWRYYHIPTLALFLALFAWLMVSKNTAGWAKKRAELTGATSWAFASKVLEMKEIMVMLIGSAVVFFAMKNRDGLPVQIVGDIPSGLPGFHAPFDQPVMDVLHGPPEDLGMLVANAAMIAVASFLLSWGAVKQAALTKRYDVDATKELRALGFASAAGSCFGAISVQCALTRTALAVQIGTHTQVASLVSAVVIGFILFFFAPLLYYIPSVSLTAIVMMAIQGLMNYEMPTKFLRSSRRAFRAGMHVDLVVWCVGFICTLVFGAIIGFGAVVLASLIQVLAEVIASHAANHDSAPLKRHQNAEEHNGMLVIELRGRLCFYKAEELRDECASRLTKDAKVVILSLVGVSHVDYTSLVTLKDVLIDFKRQGVTCILVEVEPLLSEWLGEDLQNLVTSTCTSAQKAFAACEHGHDHPVHP